ncbi:MAG: SET domain-containing protein-lysine N-methyltransferase [Oligoflexia bacterium]|nr:SET domain-containing protein-lysine N-methyltransferase [Oligoflexia bacterium]
MKSLFFGAIFIILAIFTNIANDANAASASASASASAAGSENSAISKTFPSPETLEIFRQLNVEYTNDLVYPDLLCREMTLITPMQFERYEVRRSLPEPVVAKKILIKEVPEIHGYGAFATEVINEGEVIGMYTGEVVYQPQGEIRALLTERVAQMLISSGVEDPATYILNTYPQKLLGSDSTLTSKYYFGYMSSLSVAETSPLVVNSAKKGNEIRFVNHSHQNANSGVIMAVIPTLSRSQGSGAQRKFLLMPTLIATKQINAGAQILFDYGNEYWRTLNIEPLEIR